MRCGYPSEKRPRMPDRPSLREARLKVSSTFSKVVESRGKASGRPPQRAELSCAHKSAGGGPRGNPRRGFPLFSLRFCVCAGALGGSRCPVLRFDPISLVLAQRNGVEPPKKSAFLPRCLHHPRERCRSVDGTFLARLGEGVGGCRGFVRVRRFVGRWIVAPTANSTPFLCSCAKKRGGAPKKRAYGCRHGRCSVPPASPTDSKPQHHSRLRQADLSARSTHRVQINLTHQSVPLVLTPNGRGGRAHQGDVEASKRFSLAARHRFFGQAPKKWGRKAGQGKDYLPEYRRTRRSVNKRGEPPARVPPWTPSCAFMSTGGVPPAAAGGQGRCPWTLPPLKRWTKLSNARCARALYLRSPQG